LNKHIQSAIHFVADSNLWIALCAFGLIAQSFIIYNVPVVNSDAWYLLFSFCNTYIIYNLHRIITIPAKEFETLSGMHGFIAQYKMWVFAAMMLAAILSFVCLFFISMQSIIALAILGAIAVFYTFPLPFGIRLRDFGYLKPFIVATVWSFVAVLVPLANYIQDDILNISLLWLNRFLFIVAITIPFDVRDLKFDKVNLKYATIPMRIGKLRTYWLSQGLLMISAMPLLVVLFLEQTIEAHLIPLLMWYLITSSIIRHNLKSKTEVNEYQYTFWLDGTMVLGYLLFLIGNLMLH
jgi:hypothetical protein